MFRVRAFYFCLFSTSCEITALLWDRQRASQINEIPCQSRNSLVRWMRLWLHVAKALLWLYFCFYALLTYFLFNEIITSCEWRAFQICLVRLPNIFSLNFFQLIDYSQMKWPLESPLEMPLELPLTRPENVCCGAVPCCHVFDRKYVLAVLLIHCLPSKTFYKCFPRHI